MNCYSLSALRLGRIFSQRSKERRDPPATNRKFEKTDFEEIRRNRIEEAHESIKDKLLDLDAYEMQDLVAAILRAMEFKPRVSPPGSDRGLDIFSSPDGLGLQEHEN